MRDTAAAPARIGAQSPWARVVTRAEAVPAWTWVTALVALSAGVRFAIARGYPSPWTWTDELLYAELAKSFGTSGHFAIREVAGRAGFGFVYPVVLSPAYALFTSVPAAYTAMKAINAVVMSLGAVPTYLLARRLTGRWLGLLAALLAVALPDLTYTVAIMTENAFFPIFLFWCWSLVLALERPTIVRQLVVLALLLLAYLTRPQAVMLAPALLTALALVILLDAAAARNRPFPRALVTSGARFVATGVVLAAGVVGFLLLEIVVRGKTWDEAVLGPYSSLTAEHYSATAIWHWFVYHVGELAFAVAVIPFAALLLLGFAALDPRERRELRIFGVVALSVTVWLLVGVAAFASSAYGLRIEERGLLYLQPLFLVALVACVATGLLWRRRTAAGVAALVTVGFVAAVPFSSFVATSSAANDAFSLLPLQSVLQRHLVGLGQLQTAVIAGAVVAAMLFLLVSPRLGLALPAVVLAVFVFAAGPVHTRTQIASVAARFGAMQGKRDWIDRAVGTKRRVAVLWTNRAAFVSLWANEFFNRSVGNVYTSQGRPDGLPEYVALRRSNGALVNSIEQPIREQYMLADPTVTLAGEVVARDPSGMTVYRTAGRVAIRAELTGIYPDRWSGAEVGYNVYRCARGTVTTVMTSDPKSHPFAQTVTATIGSKQYRKVLKLGRFNIPFTTPVTPDAHGACRVRYTISPTAVPNLTIGNGDTRALGTRFVSVTYRPRHGRPVTSR